MVDLVLTNLSTGSILVRQPTDLTRGSQLLEMAGLTAVPEIFSTTALLLGGWVSAAAWSEGAWREAHQQARL